MNTTEGAILSYIRRIRSGYDERRRQLLRAITPVINHFYFSKRWSFPEVLTQIDGEPTERSTIGIEANFGPQHTGSVQNMSAIIFIGRVWSLS